jgi:hypothetical protein
VFRETRVKERRVIHSTTELYVERNKQEQWEIV